MDSRQARNVAITRRAFVKITGAVIFVAATGGCNTSTTDGDQATTRAPTLTSAPHAGQVPAPADTVQASSIPAADGYLLVDVEKCQGCMSCVLACSLIHEGVESLSLSRIQIVQNSFAPFPDDVAVEQCRQCVDPACVQVCPTGALAADAAHGNVRVVDAETCIGCGQCHDACPYTPSRAFLAADDAFGGEDRSRKCDLCAYAPYHWAEAGGGPGGEQACVAVCPVGAITFTAKIPMQEGDGGYHVDLRDRRWGSLGYPTN
jgi:protein NrfC